MTTPTGPGTRIGLGADLPAQRLEAASKAGAPAPASFAVVGNGWRSGFFHRPADALPDLLRVTGVVTRSEESAQRASQERGVPGFTSLSEMIAADRPDFVIVSVPREQAPQVLIELVEAGIPSLVETPPANQMDDLRALWDAVGHTDLVHVAEQYPRYPGHLARKAVIDRGLIGTPTSVQLSSTHEYHAIAVMRRLLGAGRGEVAVRSQSFGGPLVDPLTRDAWTGDEREQPASTLLSTLDFGDSMGLYDFTSNQWHNQLRHRRIVVRGSRGEIVDDDVVWLDGPQTILEAPITRRQRGYDLDLDGYTTEYLNLGGDVLWRNPFDATRFSDEEIALADMLVTAGAWARGEGEGPYSLADGCHDQAISLAINASLATGQTVHVGREGWSDR